MADHDFHNTSATHAPEITALPEQRGVHVFDPIEDAHFNLYTREAVTPTPADTDAFYFPVSVGAAIETTGLETPMLLNAWVRTREGGHVATSDYDEPLSLPHGSYSIELSSTPMKLYLAVEGAVTIRPANHSTHIVFDEPTTVRVGARSFHTQPAGTITVPDDPETAMRAFSAFGSALKTTSPERSFPTLRGHPPLVERGETLDIPPGFEPPETDVTLELPPEYRYIYPATPLAYYLGATMRPGPEPRLVTGDHAEPLPAEEYERTVERLLKQFFTLDCYVRTVGFFDVSLHGTADVTATLDSLGWSLEGLYDLPLAERTRAYLGVPWDAVEPYAPRWQLTADVAPLDEHTPMLPFLAQDLAVVRCPVDQLRSLSLWPEEEPEEPLSEEALVQREAIHEFYRTASTAADFTRSAASTEPARTSVRDESRPETTVRMHLTDSINHSWIGPGFPMNASKPTLAAYERQLTRQKPPGSRIDVHVVCNDPEMRNERIVGDIYGTHDLLDFDVAVSTDITREELAEVFASTADFVHFIGHVGAEGMQCADGYLDVADIEEVNVASFLLNACRSYRQGQQLVERGAIGGIVTLSKVLNTPATAVGRSIARLLNHGWGLATALSLVRDENLAGRRYIVVGDGSAELVQSESGTQIVAVIEDADEFDFSVNIDMYPSRSYPMGAIFTPYIGESNHQYLNSGFIEHDQVNRSQLKKFFEREAIPVKMKHKDNRLVWSDDIDLDSL